MRYPFRRRYDEWFRFEPTNTFLIAKDKGGIISPIGECVWMAIDSHNGYMYLEKSFLRLLKQMITEWKHDKHLAG